MNALFSFTVRKGRWTIHIHTPDPSLGMKHVHIERADLLGQYIYSWNINGTRHDKHKFPLDERSIKKAKALAAEQLKIPARTLTLIDVIPWPYSIDIYTEPDLEIKPHGPLVIVLPADVLIAVLRGEGEICLVVLADQQRDSQQPS